MSTESTQPLALWRRVAAYLVPVVSMIVGLELARSAWVAFLLYHVGMIAVLGWGRVAANARLLRVGGSRTLLVAALLFGALGGPTILLLRPWLDIPPDLAGRLAGLGLSGATWWAFMAYHSMVNPWLEEIFWRGCLDEKGRRPTLVDAAFGAYHLIVLAYFVSPAWLPLEFVVLAGTSWFWRLTRRWTGGLRVAGLSHCAADVSVMIAAHQLAF